MPGQLRAHRLGAGGEHDRVGLQALAALQQHARRASGSIAVTRSPRAQRHARCSANHSRRLDRQLGARRARRAGTPWSAAGAGRAASASWPISVTCAVAAVLAIGARGRQPGRAGADDRHALSRHRRRSGRAGSRRGARRARASARSALGQPVVRLVAASSAPRGPAPRQLTASTLAPPASCAAQPVDGAREGRRVEVVEDLRADDQVQAPAGACSGKLACASSTRRQRRPARSRASSSARAEKSIATSSSQRGASSAVNTPIEQPTSSTRAERARRQRGERVGVLLALVVARRVAPRVRAGS